APERNRERSIGHQVDAWNVGMMDPLQSIGKYTWHHLDDFDPATGKGTMQLIANSAHEATLPHTGSVAQFEKHFGLSSGAYGTPEAVAISQDQGWLKGRHKKIVSSTC
ncbi:HNH endonuclease, partial [Pseudomonas putida]